MKYLIGKIEDAISRRYQPFLKVTATDENKASVTLYVWDNLDGFKAATAASKVLEISANMQDQFPKVDSFLPVPDVDMTKFVKTAFTSDLEAMAIFNQLLTKITMESFRDLNLKLFGPFKQKFITATAAKGMHHNIHGGLLLHTYELMQFAEAICDSSLGETLNKQVVLEGCLLHDIGKIADYSTADEANFDYSVEFYTSNHLARGAEIVTKYGDTTRPEIQHLMHIIRSHHGLKEWDAICVPATREASLVFVADWYSAAHNKFLNAEFDAQGMAKVGRAVCLDFDKMYGGQRND